MEIQSVMPLRLCHTREAPASSDGGCEVRQLDGQAGGADARQRRGARAQASKGSWRSMCVSVLQPRLMRARRIREAPGVTSEKTQKRLPEENAVSSYLVRRARIGPEPA